MDELRSIVERLQLGQSLPESCRPHPLLGDWTGFWECHIESDWLLIWQTDADSLYLARTGSHSDLFR